MDMKEMQKAVYQNKLDKGFNVTDLNLEFCLLYGEVAEAYEAWLKKTGTVGEELADVAIYLLGLAEILGLDLQAEIERKMEINRRRHYEMKNGGFTENGGGYRVVQYRSIKPPSGPAAVFSRTPPFLQIIRREASFSRSQTMRIFFSPRARQMGSASRSIPVPYPFRRSEGRTL